MTAFEHFKGLFGLSCGFWMIFGLCYVFSIKKFIVKRYEEESDLGRTVFFTHHMPFAKYSPDFFSSSFYCAHLLAFIWGWKAIKFIKEKRPKVTYFSDIDSPEFVTRHFSTKEIRRVKTLAIIGMITILHCIAYYCFKSIWPERFN